MGRVKKVLTEDDIKFDKVKKPKRIEDTHLRPCHDCKRLQRDYRCPRCLAKWRSKHQVSYADMIAEGIHPNQCKGGEDE